MKLQIINILLLMSLLLSVSCTTDELAQTELDETHVYYISEIVKPDGNVVDVEASAYTVYDDAAMLITWKNEYQVIRKNKLSFFTLYNVSQPEGDKVSGTPLKFSFNEDYEVESVTFDPVTGREETVMKTVSRAFIFDGSIDDDGKGSGNLTIIENNGDTATFQVTVQETTKLIDNDYHAAMTISE